MSRLSKSIGMGLKVTLGLLAFSGWVGMFALVLRNGSTVGLMLFTGFSCGAIMAKVEYDLNG